MGPLLNSIDTSVELQDGDELFRAITDLGQALIWAAGLDKGCFYFNQPWLNFTGRTLEQEFGDGWVSGVHPEDLRRCLNIYATAFDRREKFSMDYRLRRHDGEYRWILDEGAPRYDSQGQFVGYVGHCLDITERKELEAALQESKRFLTESQRIAGLGSYVLDIATGLWRSSEVFDMLFGIDETFVRSVEGWAALVHPKDRSMMIDYFRNQVLGQGHAFDKEYRIVRYADQAERWVHGLGNLELDGQGRPLRMHGTIQDITERKLADDALRDSELRYRRLADNSPLAIQVFSPDGTTVRVNAAWERLWQVPFSALEGYNVLKDPQLEELGLLSIVKRSFAGETVVFPVHLYDKARATGVANSGGQLWLSAFAYPVQGESGELLEVVLVQEDITERKRLEDKVHQLAFYDSLTQLANRRLLDDRLSQAVATNKRNGHFAALMFLDLDNFKPLNDVHGHAAGDLLLMETATRLKNCMREMDTVARFGGDEFVVLIMDLTSDRAEATLQAEIVAEKVRSRLAEPYRLNIRRGDAADAVIRHQCTVSIGIVVFSSDDIAEEDIFKQADTAMYKAKSGGGDLIRFYDSAD